MEVKQGFVIFSILFIIFLVDRGIQPISHWNEADPQDEWDTVQSPLPKLRSPQARSSSRGRERCWLLWTEIQGPRTRSLETHLLKCIREGAFCTFTKIRFSFARCTCFFIKVRNKIMKCGLLSTLGSISQWRETLIMKLATTSSSPSQPLAIEEKCSKVKAYGLLGSRDPCTPAWFSNVDCIPAPQSTTGVPAMLWLQNDFNSLGTISVLYFFNIPNIVVVTSSGNSLVVGWRACFQLLKPLFTLSFFQPW